MSRIPIALFVLSGLACASPPPLTLKVDGGKAVRKIPLSSLLGGNIAVWYQPEQIQSPALKNHFASWKPGIIRMPGGSWSDELVWNGNGVRSGKSIDLSKRTTDGWQIDYSGYAPGFRLKADPAKPGAITVADYHGNLDIRTLHEFIRNTGSPALVTVNAGTGTPEMAAEWLKWTKREGYEVAYWEVGNELDGEWELGHIMPNGKRMTDADYARRFKQFAAALKAVDPAVRVGGPACSNDQLLFVETLIREAGDTLDFVSFHTYPVLGGKTPEASRFAQANDVAKAVERINGWIRKYHPQREGKIAIGISEWHKQVAETRPTVDLSSGLWACLFIGAMANSGVSFANIWDCYSQTESGGHGLFDGKSHLPRAMFHAMTLWRHHMKDGWLKVSGSDETLRAFATKNDDGVSLMVVNTSLDQARRISLDVDGKPRKGRIAAARLASNEYLWNPHTRQPEWSLPPSEVVLETSADGLLEILPFSAYVLKLGATATKPTDPEKPGAPELAILLPENSPADLAVEGMVVVRREGTREPWQGTIREVEIAVEGPAGLAKSTVAMNGPVGTFTIQPTSPGKCKISARAGDRSTSASFTITPVMERNEIHWTFSNDASIQGMQSDYQLAVDQQVRPNQAVAAVSLKQAVSRPKQNTLLAINTFPASLDKKRIGGVTALAGASADLSCDDPGAAVQIVLQSNNDHWIPLGVVKLKGLTAGKKEIRFRGTGAGFHEAMPELYSLRFMLNTSKPVTGTIHLDDIGFILRSE